MSYDFHHAFSPAQFEEFARDMLQVKENLVFESFAEGRDLGIDGRSVSEDGYTVIFQAKRLKNAGKDIVRIMRDEKKKMDRLIREGKKADRYILVISDDLGVETKNKICQLMDPYIIDPKDIVTGKDLNNWISDERYRSVENKYYQLWIPSTNVLQETLFRIVNSALVQRSVNRYEKLLDKRNVFVETDVFAEAVCQLRKNKVIIVSGEPGVGKTTLAEQLALYFFAKYRYESFMDISSVDDLYTASGTVGKKVLLYDDFWGSNGFDRYDSSRRSRELVEFIEHIRRKKDCLLIMTTREYILEQGLKENEDLRELIIGNRLECRIEQYSDEDKLQIYYGHLKHARLTWEQTRELQMYGDDVIFSDNYNPRVIELFTKSVSIEMSPKECLNAFEKYLECPVDFWKKIFHDLSQEAQVLYVLLLIFPMPAELTLLEACYGEALKGFENTFGWKSFSDVIIELEKTVLRTDLYNQEGAGVYTATFQNPSAKDFLITLFREDFKKYYELLRDNCRYYARCVELLKVLNEVKAPVEIYTEILEKAINAVKTASISFLDKYRVVLNYGRELKKYHKNYRTEQECRDIGYGRIFQLILLYRKECGERLQSRMRGALLHILYEIEHYPEHVLIEDMQELPEVIVAAYREGILDDITRMMEIYMNSLMRNRMEISYLRFKKDFPEVWEKYVENHWEQIEDYLKKYFDAELCLAAISEDPDEFFYLYCMCEECYELYGMVIPDELQDKINLYDSWIPVSVEEEEGESELVESGREKKTVSEIQDEFEENFLKPILPKRIFDIEEWFETCTAPDRVKQILRQTDEKGHFFWNSFFYDEDSLDYLEAFIMFMGELPETLEKVFYMTANYMEETSGLSREELLEFMNRLDQTDKKRQSWSEAELENLCPELFFDHEDILEKMAEAHILVNSNHWYRLSNDLLILSVQIADALSSNEKKKGYYEIVQKRLADGEMKYQEMIFWDTLYRLDAECFKKYILSFAVHYLYGEIVNSGKHWLKAVIDLVDIEIEFEQHEIMGGNMNGDVLLEILTIYLGTELFELIPDEFTDEQIVLMKEHGLLGEEKQTVKLQELEEHGLLDNLGIYENLVTFWENICKLQEEV